MYFNDAGNGDHLNFDSELLLSYEAANFIIMNRFFKKFSFIVHSSTIHCTQCNDYFTPVPSENIDGAVSVSCHQKLNILKMLSEIWNHKGLGPVRFKSFKIVIKF